MAKEKNEKPAKAAAPAVEPETETETYNIDDILAEFRDL